ncbi:hypothetical protein BIW11_09481 [Tropilaelaps mercedesae]|uniref:Uncharacterized protein n=1 Tax=Tropilaelaps mercedesae TaxID=418985 RepID=A0A1V9XJW8_9ACAR|nr:hypothetical protein BIW11_09481 [Tropilaelaps mercedesae]
MGIIRQRLLVVSEWQTASMHEFEIHHHNQVSSSWNETQNICTLIGAVRGSARYLRVHASASHAKRHRCHFTNSMSRYACVCPIGILESGSVWRNIHAPFGRLVSGHTNKNCSFLFLTQTFTIRRT